MNSKLRDILIELLHKHDHEPDEITKFVVIDQTEFVPEAEKAILALIDQQIKDVLDEVEKGILPPKSGVFPGDLGKCSLVNTEPYANGWNDCREEVRSALSTIQKIRSRYE